MIYGALRKVRIIFFCLTVLGLTIFCLGSFSHALDEVEEYVTASDGTKIQWGIQKGYEQSDETGRNLDPIMYHGHKPDVEKATALEIAKAWWYQIRGQYADNLYGGGFPGQTFKGFEVAGYVKKTNKRGLSRDSATRRWVTNWPKKNGLDYKDAIVFLTPEDMRGLAMIIWHYADFEKDYDQWIWVPALRKVRKAGAMEGEDSFGGMDLDYDDGFLRHPFQDTHKIIRIEVVDDKFIDEQRKIMSHCEDFIIDKISKYYKEEAFGHKMWVDESLPKLTRMSYNKRIVWYEQDMWRLVKCEWYDEKGRKVKNMYRNWMKHSFYNSDKTHTFERDIYVGNALTGHHSEVLTKKVEFNHPKVKPELFSIRALMRRRW